MRLNWAHGNRGLGFRYDAGEDGDFGEGNEMLLNVGWDNGQGGLSSKANRAQHLRNLMLQNQLGDDPEKASFGAAADMKICACYPADCAASSGDKTGVADSGRTNIGSITRGNVGMMDPGTNGLSPSELPGTSGHNLNLLLDNFSHLTADNLVRDFANLDFRPLSGGPMIASGIALDSQDVTEGAAAAVLAAGTGRFPEMGPYDHNSTVYWIPGQQSRGASSLVPPANATRVRPDADLMFLGGALATSHDIYVEGSWVATLTAPANIYVPDAPFVPGRRYTWRVDAAEPDGTVTRGDDHSFTAGCADLRCESCGESTSAASCLDCAEGLVLVGGRCAPDGGCVSGGWSVAAVPSSYGDTRRHAFVGGAYTDTFDIRGGPSDGCTAYALDALSVYITRGNASSQLSGFPALSCANQQFTLSAAWRCDLCASGFAPNEAAASKCVLIEPPSPPTPPAAPPSPAPPPLPPPPRPCPGWCRSHAASWGAKCAWTTQTACKDCAECYIPPPTSPPPSTTPPPLLPSLEPAGACGSSCGRNTCQWSCQAFSPGSKICVGAQSDRCPCPPMPWQWC